MSMTEYRKRRRYNEILTRALTTENRVKLLKECLDKDRPGNDILNDKSNEEFVNNVKTMASQDLGMHSKKFVINNIENLYPSTLKKLIKKSELKGSGGLVRKEDGKKKRMDSYDAEVILRLWTSGVCLQTIADKFPEYSHRQLRRVKDNIFDIRSKQLTSDLSKAITRTQTERKTHWF